MTGGRAPTDCDARKRTLIGLLLADAFSDGEVARRELYLREGMIDRLQCALDKLVCAQAILEAEESNRRGNSGGEAWDKLAKRSGYSQGIGRRNTRKERSSGYR